MFRLLSLLFVVSLSATACAKNSESVNPAQVSTSADSAAEVLAPDAVALKLRQVRPDLILTNVRDSDIPSFYVAQVVNGPEVYISKTGQHLIAGDVYELGATGLVDLVDKRLSSVRQDALKTVASMHPISFNATVPTKAVIYVFTDVDCGYCQKLHAEMAGYNALGIEVRYLAYPRAGIGSPAYRKIASAWCASDQNDALTKLKQRQAIPDNVCDGNPVADHYALGRKLGVRGTPAILLEDGRLLPGYRNPTDMAAALGI